MFFETRSIRESLYSSLVEEENSSDSTLSTQIAEQDVQNVFAKAKVRKATGPDGVSNRMLKLCSQQLAYVFSCIYQFVLDSAVIPQIWKTSAIIPVPKISKPKELNQYRPVALTSNVMKCLERILLRFFRGQVG